MDEWTNISFRPMDEWTKDDLSGFKIALSTLFDSTYCQARLTVNTVIML